jgi:hypothetical protein
MRKEISEQRSLENEVWGSKEESAVWGKGSAAEVWHSSAAERVWEKVGPAMPGNEQNKSTKATKAYEPPKVMRVSLRPEEAVLGHCKVTGNAGPVSSTCRGTVTCRTVGS